MSSILQAALVFLAVIVSYVWLNMPSLDYYSPQFAGVFILTYFIIRYGRLHFSKKTNKNDSTGPEFALVSLATLILIGSTGNTESFFFPLSFLHIFFLTMRYTPVGSLLLTGAIVIFHLGLSENPNLETWSDLMAIILLLFVFLFAKKQYEEKVKKQILAMEKDEALSERQAQAILFLTTFLKPKLTSLLHLMRYPTANKEVIIKQLAILDQETDSVLDEEKIE